MHNHIPGGCLSGMLPVWAVSVDNRPPHCWLSRCLHLVWIDDCVGSHGDSNQEQISSEPSSSSRLRMLLSMVSFRCLLVALSGWTSGVNFHSEMSTSMINVLMMTRLWVVGYIVGSMDSRHRNYMDGSDRNPRNPRSSQQQQQQQQQHQLLHQHQHQHQNQNQNQPSTSTSSSTDDATS
jgi:hypothetical protein